jgi:hypothetical protein
MKLHIPDMQSDSCWEVEYHGTRQRIDCQHTEYLIPAKTTAPLQLLEDLCLVYSSRAHDTRQNRPTLISNECESCTGSWSAWIGRVVGSGKLGGSNRLLWHRKSRGGCSRKSVAY